MIIKRATSTVENTDPSEHKMDSGERENLKNEIREKEEMAEMVKAEVRESGDGRLASIARNMGQDPKLQRKRMALERDEALVLRGRDKDDAVRKIRELEEEVVRDRPTTEMMNAPLGTRESVEAVQANMSFWKKHGKTMIEIQNLRKRLEPDDPRSNDTEYLRPDVYGRGPKRI